jgi:transcriptional regulator with XRE-family HTH domain
LIITKSHARLALYSSCHARGARPTQEELAEAADIDRTYPSLMERGLRQPTLAMLLALAGAFEIEAATLITMTVARLRREQL